ncbi:MAG: AsmA family protein [Proteobacteria bacterium]|nr:AsmA family protein [Pseudomonadota bacterium]
MTAFAGIRRLGFVLLAVAAVAVGVLTTAGYLISPETVRSEVLNGIRSATGLDPILGGKASVTLFPKGSVSFADVVLGDPNRPALTAERLTARLRFFPLLVGRVEIADISLEKPTIAIDIDRDGGSNWSVLIAALARGQKPHGNRTVAAFSEMRIDDGTLLLHKDGDRTVETLHAVDFSLAWPSISKSLGATGHFVWHGEKVEASVNLADFAAALGGGRSGVKLRLSGPPMNAAFEGAFSFKPTLKVEGTLAADAVSLRRALTWAGHEPLPGGGFGRFAIKAQTTIVGDTISLAGVNVELDGNSAEGVLSFANEGRQTLQGTLASETLNLSPYISTVRLLAGNQRAWNDARLTPEGLNGMDFDLRISAANVIMGNAKIGRTAIGANLHNGRLMVSIGEAQAFGGVIKGSVALTNFDSGVDFKSQVQFADVDLESCLGQMFGLKRLEGKGTMSMSIDGTGDSVLGVTRTLTGTASLTGRDGAISGINVEQLLRRLERRPLSGGGDFRTGRTPYDKVDITLRMTQGTVEVQDMTVESTAVRLVLAGTASIPERELDLKGTAALVTPSRAGAQPFGLPFVVQGSWDDPMMLPDAEALIRRSGAAAPLLNAVRERSARDTVRSAIERLTGGGVPTADTTPVAPKP